MKLAIGTAQFGMEYGVANKSGRVKLEEVRKIINLARSAGINTLDTAISYGESHRVLGEIGIKDFNVITKLPASETNSKNIYEAIKNQLIDALETLGQNQIKCLMLHRPAELTTANGNDLWNACCSLKKEGLTERIGYSIYSPIELENIYATYQPDIVQAPYNIFDRRMCSSGWLKKLYKDGVEVHVRSVFLQGLLLMDPFCRPIQFNRWSDIWKIWEKWVDKKKISKLQGAMHFTLANPYISKVLVGLDNANQLKEILETYNNKDILTFPEELKIDDINLISPTNWSNF